jgi:transcription-repair coupling factor (superfamily II helicase)
LELTRLLHLASEMPAYPQLINRLNQPDATSTTASVLDAAKPYLIAALHKKLGLPLLLVTSQPEDAKKLYGQISAWLGPDTVNLFPEPDTLPYQGVASDTATELERIRILAATANRGATGPPLIIASAPAIMQKVVSFSDFTRASHSIKPGMEFEPLQLLRRWQALGYRMENIVELPGTVSHRGGIVDIYPVTAELPARIEFLGNTIDSIRLFDPSSQCSLNQAASVDIVPATELLLSSAGKSRLEAAISRIDLAGLNDRARQQFEQELAVLLENQLPADMHFYTPLLNSASILSYLPQPSLLILDEPLSIQEATEALEAEATRLLEDKLEQAELPRNFPRPYLTWKELGPTIGKRKRLALTSLSLVTTGDGPRLDFAAAAGYAGRLPQFIEKIKQLSRQRNRVILVSHQAKRLSELLAEAKILAQPVDKIEQIPKPGSVTLVSGLLAQGWVMGGATYLFTDAEIFGFIRQQRLIKKRRVPRHQLSVDITPDDYVVHIEHGIARFAGVTTMTTNQVESEYLVLQYGAGDRLYVPTDQVDRVSRYIGAAGRPPLLSRLDSEEWMRTRKKAGESVAQMARELLALYATREVVPGFAFSEDTVWQQELEASFPYMETPDQMVVQKEVKKDMARARPMDRLVCGDVGYGKTEIAIRAAFKAVMDGKQVAVLVPTTVLAEQHFFTFSQRMGAFPLRIEVLSRFRSQQEQRDIISGLAAGSVDICIGTHRLLQKDVVFKDLGLLVIDEEQRFGVSHKEYLKRLRREVDVLTLSATPIPRSLHMSLVGVRDMSVMETPPEDRLPIKTYVAGYDGHLVREAVLRELERNGQAFFVHNRVQSIAYIAEKLGALVPEARLAIAHGQMPEAELEAVMADFTRGSIDLLLCTTIIESGLDVPNANTLIVNQADRFGLTQLYQLRGRIGRGANLAYAYFLHDRGKWLTPDAQKRLTTVFEASDLGAGFGIALKDLEIRGAGTLLGAKQSGHITAVGFNLYTRLLAEAVEEQKAIQAGKSVDKSRRLPPPTIDLPLAAYIPEGYIPDINTRLSLYQCLVGISSAGQVEEMARDFRDRFGALPQEVDNLLYAVRIKLLATQAAIESIATEDSQIVLRLFSGLRFDKQKLEPVMRDGITPGVTQLRLHPKRLGKGWQKVLEEVLKMV